MLRSGVRRQVADAAIDRAEERDDRSLVRRGRVQIVHIQRLIAAKASQSLLH